MVDITTMVSTRTDIKTPAIIGMDSENEIKTTFLFVKHTEVHGFVSHVLRVYH